MFAFAIYNGDDFMLARNPIGIKPLYYSYVNDNLNFPSELGAMTLAGVDEVHEFPAGHYYTPKEGFVEYYQIPEIQDDMLTPCYTYTGKSSRSRFYGTSRYKKYLLKRGKCKLK